MIPFMIAVIGIIGMGAAGVVSVQHQKAVSIEKAQQAVIVKQENTLRADEKKPIKQKIDGVEIVNLENPS